MTTPLACRFADFWNWDKASRVFVVSYYSVAGFAMNLAAFRLGVPAIDVQHGVAAKHQAVAMDEGTARHRHLDLERRDHPVHSVGHLVGAEAARITGAVQPLMVGAGNARQLRRKVVRRRPLLAEDVHNHVHIVREDPLLAIVPAAAERLKAKPLAGHFGGAYHPT